MSLNCRHHRGRQFEIYQHAYWDKHGRHYSILWRRREKFLSTMRLSGYENYARICLELLPSYMVYPGETFYWQTKCSHVFCQKQFSTCCDRMVGLVQSSTLSPFLIIFTAVDTNCSKRRKWTPPRTHSSSAVEITHYKKNPKVSKRYKLLFVRSNCLLIKTSGDVWPCLRER